VLLVSAAVLLQPLQHPASLWALVRLFCCVLLLYVSSLLYKQRYWYIPPQDSIKELMMDPAFVAAIRTAKTKVVGNYWASPEWERVNKATGGAAAGPGHGVIALGGDFFQPYNSKQHSTGGIWWRYASA
jgi:hypothetical protein